MVGQKGMSRVPPCVFGVELWPSSTNFRCFSLVNQRKPLNIVRGLEKAKTQFGKRRKRTWQTSWYHGGMWKRAKGWPSPARRAAVTTTTLLAITPDSPAELPIWTAGRNRNVRLAAILSVPKGSLDDPGLPFCGTTKGETG